MLRDAPIDDAPRCRTCGGECCRAFASVPLSWADYERLRRLGAQRLELSLRGEHRLLVDGGCEFLVGGRCAIYPDRPALCRRFICDDAVEPARAPPGPP